MCRIEIECSLFQVKPKMSKDFKMTSQDGKQNMTSLYQLLSDVLDQNPKKDKIFIKNELKIKPLLEVPKHSFKDECSPLAIVDLKLLQAAFKHFCETSDCASTKDDMQPFPKSNNQWKDSYFLSSKDLNAEGASEESDLEKTLSELQMSEISNNISDPEVLDFCNKELSGKSLSDSLYSTVPEEFSISLLVPEICENGVIPENLNCSLIKEVNQKPKLSKAVKRKKSTFSKRKKCKKKNSVLRSNVPKGIFVRNVNSTESSENCFSMSEMQENELRRDEKDLCTTEELRQNSLNAHQFSSTVPISPKNKVIAKSDSARSIKKLKENLKTIIKVKVPKPLKISRKDSETTQEKLFKSPKVISKVQNPAISLQISKVEDCEKNTNKVNRCTKTVLQAQTLFQISELSDKNTFNQNSRLSQTCSSNSIETSSFCEKAKRDTEKQSVLSLDSHSQSEKESTNSGKARLDVDSSKQEMLKKSVIESSIYKDNLYENLDYEHSHPQSEKESTNSSRARSEVDSSKQETLKKSVIQSSTFRDDIYENLDYEYDQLSDLSESESLSSPVLDVANNDRDSSGNEVLHSRESDRHSDDASNICDAKVGGKESSGDVSSSQAHRDASPKVTGSGGYNTISEDMLSSANGPLDVSKDLDIRKRWVPSKKEGGKKRPAAFSDDDSTSDSEQSFKRRSNNSPSRKPYRNVHKEQVPLSSSSKLDVISEQHFGKFNEVLEHIKNQCVNHKIIDAVHVANRYLEISSSRLDRLKIFEEIFLGITQSVCVINDVPQEALKETFDKLKAFIENPEAQRHDRELCSKIIHAYFQHSLLIEFALDLCTFFQTKGISINTQAAEAYANNAISRNAPTPTLLKFLEYVRRICNLSFPKFLLEHVLERVTRGKECYLLPVFSQLCDLLCTLDPHELSKVPLQKFMDICVKNDCWDQISRIFIAWAAKRHFPNILLRTLLSRLDEAGMLFKKLAAAVYGTGEQVSECTIFFKVLGIALMFNAYYTGLTEEENPKNNCILSANDVLHTLHEYNINLFDLEKSWCSAKWVEKYLSVDSSTAIFFSCHVVFTAVEICLRLERPKNAFQIFTNYSERLREVPEIFNKTMKSNIRAKHFNLFLEVTRLLHHSDPFDMSAFRELISTLEQGGTFLDDLKERTDVDLKVIENIFNDLLITYMNKSLIPIVCELYQYTCGRCETILKIKPLVLRGLVVTFAKHQKMIDAHSLFTLGCYTNVYQFEKPQPEDLPWKVTIMSHWTSYEMRFIIERFLQKLLPFLANKKPKAKYEDWFTVKIAFKEFPCIPSKINCLIEPPVPNTLARACNIIKCIHPNFTWTEYEDYILLSADHVYSYYINNYTQLQEKAFSVIQSRPLAFGLDADAARDVNSSLTLATQANYDFTHSSPSKPHLPGEVSSTTSDHGHSLSRMNSFGDPNVDTKRISLSSSDRSSSRTPESRLSAGEPRLPQPELKRPFPVRRPGSIYEPHPVNEMSPHFHDKSPPSKRQRTISSELSNFACTKISPWRNPPFISQSPILSHQSPQKTFPLQSQCMTSPYKHSSGTFQSPKQQDGKIVPSMQNKSGAFQSPKQHGSETISPRRYNSMHSNNTSANALITEHRNLGPKSSLLISPPKSTFGNASPWVSDDSELPLNNENLNVSSPEENVFANYSSKTRSSGLSCISKTSKCQSKKIVRKIKASRTNRSQNSQKANSRNTAVIKNSNPTTSNAALISIQQKTSTAVPSMAERVCASSSLSNHSKELSVFTVPSKSKLTAKRQLQMSKETDHPKLPPYRLPTPCKQLKVVRPITPIVKSSSLRCKTPLSFQCGSRASQQHIKRPLPLTHAASNKKTGILHVAVKESKGKMKFENFTVSFQQSSANRIITTPPVVSQNSVITSKINKCFSKNSGTTRNSAIEEPSTCDHPISVSNVNAGFAKPMFKDTNVVQARCNTNIPENVFEKIVNFLKSKILLKCRNIKEDQLLKKATTLAKTFVEKHDVQRLDSKTMKQLFEFTESN